jgi:hypothetical protein
LVVNWAAVIEAQPPQHIGYSLASLMKSRSLLKATSLE